MGERSGQRADGGRAGRRAPWGALESRGGRPFWVGPVCRRRPVDRISRSKPLVLLAARKTVRLVSIMTRFKKGFKKGLTRILSELNPSQTPVKPLSNRSEPPRALHLACLLIQSARPRAPRPFPSRAREREDRQQGEPSRIFGGGVRMSGAGRGRGVQRERCSIICVCLCLNCLLPVSRGNALDRKRRIPYCQCVAKHACFVDSKCF